MSKLLPEPAPPKGGTPGEVASLRAKLDSLKERLATQKGKGVPGVGEKENAGEVEEVPSSSDDIPSPSPPVESSLVTGTMLADAPWDRPIKKEKMEKPRKKRRKSSTKTPMVTDGAPEKSRGGGRGLKAIRDGATTDCQSQLALKAAAVADEKTGGSKGHRHHSSSSKVGKQLLKILTKGSKKDKKREKEKEEERQGDEEEKVFEARSQWELPVLGRQTARRVLQTVPGGRTRAHQRRRTWIRHFGRDPARSQDPC